MICKVNNCGGEVHFENPRGYQEGKGPFFYVYPCDKCGRLHKGTGWSVFSKNNKKAFLKDKEVIYED